MGFLDRLKGASSANVPEDQRPPDYEGETDSWIYVPGRGEPVSPEKVIEGEILATPPKKAPAIALRDQYLDAMQQVSGETAPRLVSFDPRSPEVRELVERSTSVPAWGGDAPKIDSQLARQRGIENFGE